MSPGADRSLFPKTRWSLVLLAGSGSGDDGRRAMEELITAYQYPLYRYLRLWGLGPEDARDELQDFFVHVLEHEIIARARQDRGKFRNYLLRCAKNHLANQRDRAAAKKRPHGEVPIALGMIWDEHERRYQAEPSTGSTPEDDFERAWAQAIVERAASLVAQDYAGRGDKDLFEALMARLHIDPDRESYEELSVRFGMQVSALRTALSRLRVRIGDSIRDLVSDTLTPDDDVDAEITYLMRCLGHQSSPVTNAS